MGFVGGSQYDLGVNVVLDSVVHHGNRLWPVPPLIFTNGNIPRDILNLLEKFLLKLSYSLL
jgi:hypothetical protein